MIELISLSDSGNDLCRTVETYLFGRKITLRNSNHAPVIIFFSGPVIVGVITERESVRNIDMPTTMWPELESATPISGQEIDRFGRKMTNLARSI